jgi:acetyl esterase
MKPKGRPLAVPMPGIGMPQRMRGARLDRDARAFLRLLKPFVRPAHRYTMQGLRTRWSLLATVLGHGRPVARVTERTLGGPAGPIVLRIYVPERTAALQPALIWCHGGGFLVGDAECADAMCRGMASHSGCAVVSVRYRLAPEHDLRAGREDILAALEWISRHGASIGIDGSRLAIGGDSAGGNITAAVAQRWTEEGRPALRLQVLVYPATNLRNDYPSKAENGREHLLTAETMDWIQSHITGSLDLGDPWISPGLNPRLAGLPPALIVTAGFDPVRDDGLDYAARLRHAGVPVELLHYAGQFHGFLNFDALIVAGRDALARIGGSLGRALRAGEPVDRTLEIADDATRAPLPVMHATGELTSMALVAWESVGRWSATLLRLVSPVMGAATLALWRPWLAPATWARRRVGERLGRLTARQTHPLPRA